MEIEQSFLGLLNKVREATENGIALATLLQDISGQILELLGAERVTFYKGMQDGKTLEDIYKSSQDNKKIIVPYTPASIAGYVALTQKPVLIYDVTDSNELSHIHPKLAHNAQFIQHSGLHDKAMLVVPIKSSKEILLGVIQVINSHNEKGFVRRELKYVLMLAHVLVDIFSSTLHHTDKPFSYLLQQQLISPDILHALQEKVKHNPQLNIEMLLRKERVAANVMGHALQAYYQVPYFPYQQEQRLPYEICQNLAPALLRKYLWVPIAGDRTEIEVLLNNPADKKTLLLMETLLKAEKYTLKLGLQEDILRYIEKIRIYHLEKKKDKQDIPVSGSIMRLQNQQIADTTPYSKQNITAIEIDSLEKIGKYKIVKILGQGAMGIVYQGFDEKLQRQVAIKVLQPHLLEGESGKSMASQFAHEAQVAGHCLHENIIVIFEYDEDNGLPYLVMEYSSGLELIDYLMENDGYNVKTVTHIILQLLQALQYIHKLGIVHRDVKPANIIVLNDGTVKLVDFGIAKKIADIVPGEVAGTKSYMSPEQAKGEWLDARSDLFSVAVILCELLSSLKLLSSGVPVTIIDEIGHVIKNRRITDRSEIPDEFVALLSKALALDPDKRYQSAIEFADILRRTTEDFSDTIIGGNVMLASNQEMTVIL